MHIFWVLTETDPASDDGPYENVLDYLMTERNKDPRRFIYTSKDYISAGNLNELDLFEIWLANVDDAMLFKLAWPFTNMPLLSTKPKANGVEFI